MPKHNRQTLADLLGADLGAFALYCSNAATDNAKIVDYLWRTTAGDGVDVNSAGFQVMMGMLLVDGIVSQATYDRVQLFGST